MTSAELRQSFLDFFASKQHAIVPSASLMPSSPNLLFTNAGMNQFVPYFLGEREAPYRRAADTQKCIRAGGKHNDLEDVGFDTYHHTLFEMLGNWSFGDYFKRDSLEWGWELLTKVWGLPPKRLFATVYSPAEGDPSEFDQEAYNIWAKLFTEAGLDPAVHIVNGNKKDNFWMMGDTGPCGPCSEVHFNLLPSDDEAPGRALVNGGSPRCIEIWNHVFIQFNANADGTFSPLAAKHVDTGMGFERVAGIYATSKGFTDFSAEPSNYNADVFAPLFAKVAELSGKTFAGTVPSAREGLSEQEQIDVAFRVLADHARCISCSIADGILPGNEGRNYVVRRILRRGILYGKKLGLSTGFFEQLVEPVVQSLGEVFPELKQQENVVRRVIRSEEESFGRTLDRGLQLFEKAAASGTVSGKDAFALYDTFGFPLDMTELLATERGLSVNTAEFERLMEEQRERGRAAQKKEIIVAAKAGDETAAATAFVGYDPANLVNCPATLIDVVVSGEKSFLVFDRSPFYAEMGGQLGDRGSAEVDGTTFQILDTVKDKSGRHLHRIEGSVEASLRGQPAVLNVDLSTRRAIQRHHSATHLLHWALRKVLGTHVRQAGSLVTADRLRFDFAHFEAVKPEQLREMEGLVNRFVLEDAPVAAYETEFDQKPADTLAFFGEKYGSVVRVVDIGGYSRELCGGTHVQRTGEIGLIKIVAESAIAAGSRRLEAVVGESALSYIGETEKRLELAARKLGVSANDLDKKLDQLLAEKAEADKQLKALQQKAAAGQADELAAKATAHGDLKVVAATVNVASPNDLRTLGAQVLGKLGEGVVVLGAVFADDKVSVAAFASSQAVAAGQKAGDIVKSLVSQLGGSGGGKPDFAMGGGKDPAALPAVLAAFVQQL
jgi:alanyl-tRNA synthetase